MVPPFVRQFLDIYFTQFTLYNMYNLSKIWKDCYNVWFNGFVSAPSVSSALLLLVPPISASEHAERVLSDYNIDSKLDWDRTSQLRARAETIVHFREVEKSRTKRAERERKSPAGREWQPSGVDCAHGGRPHKYRRDIVQGGGHLHGQGKAERLGSLLLLWLRSQAVSVCIVGMLSSQVTMPNNFVS